MGLAFHVKGYACNARWSYTGFHEFRKKLANSIGIDLEEMQGFRKKHPVDERYIKPGIKSWVDIKSPIKYLLNHSDSEGFLTSEQCELIFPILNMILVLWEEDDYDKQNGFLLLHAMQHCASKNKNLTFS